MKHFKEPFAVFAVGMGLALTAIAFEVRSNVLTLEDEAACYTMAGVSRNYDAAARHRASLVKYRELENDDIILQVGFTLGFIAGRASNSELSEIEIASKIYEAQCKES